MNHHLEKNCEGVDASVFSGDVLYDDESRAELKKYIGRWTRAIAEHEGAAPTAPAPTEPVADKLADRALAKSFRENPREASLADQAGMRRAISDPLTNRAFNMDGCTPPSAAVQAAQPEAVGRNDSLKKGPAWEAFSAVYESMCERPITNRELAWRCYRAALASAPTEPMSAPTAEPVAFVHWPISGPPRLVWYSNAALEDAILKTHKGYQPDLLLYATPPSAATPEPSDAERLDAELWRLAIRKGIVTLHSERIDDRNQHTRCSWMQGHDKACDISNNAHDAAIRATKGGKL